MEMRHVCQAPLPGGESSLNLDTTGEAEWSVPPVVSSEAEWSVPRYSLFNQVKNLNGLARHGAPLLIIAWWRREPMLLLGNKPQ
jgi:hypothetical protein